MPLSTEERSLRASRARSSNARRRRFQRYLQEMRDQGLVVYVQAPLPDGSRYTPQEYSPAATFAAVYQ